MNNLNKTKEQESDLKFIDYFKGYRLVSTGLKFKGGYFLVISFIRIIGSFFNSQISTEDNIPHIFYLLVCFGIASIIDILLQQNARREL